MTKEERQATIKANREACEKILRAHDRTWADLERLRRETLSDTPFDVLAALLWAYWEIERLEAPHA